MKYTIITGLLFSNLCFAGSKYESIAEHSWRKSFSSHTYCKDMHLSISCVENEIAVLCETAPISKPGDMNCYELLEILAFIDASKSETGKMEIIGKSHPTW